MSLKPIVFLACVVPLVIAGWLILPVAGQDQDAEVNLRTIEPAMRGARGRGQVDPADELLSQDQTLEAQIAEFVDRWETKFNSAANADRAEARRALAELLEKQFAARQKLRIREIAEIDGRAKRMREMHDKRAAAKTQLVELRLDELMGNAEGLGWTEGFNTVAGRSRASSARGSAASARGGFGTTSSSFAEASRRAAFDGGFASAEQLRQALASQSPDDPVVKDLALETQIRAALDHLTPGKIAEAAQTPEQVRKTVVALLDLQFEVRQQRRAAEIAEIERQIATLRDVLNKRSVAKQKIIDRRLTELFNEAEGFGWGEPGLPLSDGVRRASPAARGARGRGVDRTERDRVE